MASGKKEKLLLATCYLLLFLLEVKSMPFFLGKDRAYHQIESCSILNLPKLQQWLSLLAQAAEQYDWESDEIDSILNQIYKLAGIEPDWVDRHNQEEVLRLITEVNFEKVASSKEQGASEEDELTTYDLRPTTSESLSLTDYCYLTVASLVNAELAVDLESALSIARSIPLTELEGYLKYRIRFLNGDDKKEEEEKAGKELMQELTDGSFFGDSKDGKDEFQAGIMKAMGMG